MLRAVSSDTLRLALGHMIIPIRLAPSLAASSASAAFVTPHTFTVSA